MSLTCVAYVRRRSAQNRTKCLAIGNEGAPQGISLGAHAPRRQGQMTSPALSGIPYPSSRDGSTADHPLYSSHWVAAEGCARQRGRLLSEPP